MQRIEQLLFTRPQSIGTFAAFGLAAAFWGKVWAPLGFAVIALLFGLLVYFAFRPSLDVMLVVGLALFLGAFAAGAACLLANALDASTATTVIAIVVVDLLIAIVAVMTLADLNSGPVE